MVQLLGLLLSALIFLDKLFQFLLVYMASRAAREPDWDFYLITVRRNLFRNPLNTLFKPPPLDGHEIPRKTHLFRKFFRRLCIGLGLDAVEEDGEAAVEISSS